MSRLRKRLRRHPKAYSSFLSKKTVKEIEPKEKPGPKKTAGRKDAAKRK